MRTAATQNMGAAVADMKRETGVNPVRSRRCDKRVLYKSHCFHMLLCYKICSALGQKKMGRGKA